MKECGEKTRMKEYGKNGEDDKRMKKKKRMKREVGWRS